MRELFEKLIKRFRSFITYGLVGCINTLTDFAVSLLMNSVVGLSAAWSQGIGYMVGVCTSFILNRRFTFRSGSNRIWAQVFRFAAVNGLSLVVSTGLIRFLTESLELPFIIAKVGVTVVVMVINYFGYKLLVFGVKNEQGENE